MNSLQWKETTQEKQTRTKNIKHKNQTTLLTNITQKTPELQGKQLFVIDRKQNKKQDKNKNAKQKQKKHQKQSQHRNRKAETYTMKTETRTTEEKINSQKLKQLGFQMLESLFQINNQTLGKEKASKRKTKETLQRVCVL